jgi:hypothetical protein
MTAKDGGNAKRLYGTVFAILVTGSGNLCRNDSDTNEK